MSRRKSCYVSVKLNVCVYVLLAIRFLCAGAVSAQSFSEWFKQKKTQKKYLLAQIAALQTDILAVEAGYGIVGDGLSVISSLKQGDLLLHSQHFNSLARVSSTVKNYPKVAAILDMEAGAAITRNRMMGTKELAQLLNSWELEQLRQLSETATTEAGKDLETLELLITDTQVKVTDDERIAQIDLLYTGVHYKVSGLLALARHIQALVASRVKQADDSRTLKQLNGKYPW